MKRCIAYGLVTETDIAVRGADPLSCGASALVAELRIEIGAPFNATDANSPIYWLENGYLHFAPAGVGRYRCAPNGIEINVAPAADPELVEGLLIATALPALLWMRGAFVLHAAAALLPGSDRAVIFAGPSGIGKSTIIAQLTGHGARLIADDSVCLALSANAVSVSGLCEGYFLSEAAALPRRFRSVPAAARCQEAQLGAICFVTRNESRAPFERISGVGAIEQLLVNRHRPKVPDLLGLHGSRLHDCAQIAHRVPAYFWHRGESRPALSSVEHETLAKLARGEEWTRLSGTATTSGSART
ncbi:hypothetical protein [Sphingomonas baiyangensis]|uniref:Serine kinase n=1 Tax=Sphingomonas baiyangensis TaxID=2572576 RepID=A0A4U1L492_9SPHN|nr:hypothetical protein [Sphingomonas baiyangensis]TKD51572.1 hypothetical protein FBR43_13015 [Sphingomonas baiyangensis]